MFEKVVLVSLVEIEETPSSQLQIKARSLPDPFQRRRLFSVHQTIQNRGVRFGSTRSTPHTIICKHRDAGDLRFSNAIPIRIDEDLRT